MNLPETNRLLKTLGGSKIKYEELELWDFNKGISQHQIFVLDLTTLLAPIGFKFPDLAALHQDGQLGSLYIDGITVEILNIMGHYRNYFAFKNGIKFTGVVVSSKPDLHRNLIESIITRLIAISKILPWLYILPLYIENKYENVAFICRILSKMFARSHKEKKNPELMIYTANHDMEVMTALGENVKLFHSSVTKSKRTFTWVTLNSIYLNYGINHLHLPLIERKRAVVALLGLFRLSHVSRASLGHIRKKKRAESIERLILENVGSNAVEFVVIFSTLFQDDDERSNYISRTKSILPEGYDHQSLTETVLGLWKDKIYERRLHELGDAIRTFDEDQDLHIEWLQ